MMDRTDAGNQYLNIKGIGSLYGGRIGGNYAGSVFDQNYVAPPILTCTGGNRQPMIIVNYKQRQNEQ